jgi:hypothetical protein
MANILGQRFDRVVQIYIAAITTYGIYLAGTSTSSPSRPVHGSNTAMTFTSGHWMIPTTLIASGVALTIINYLLKRWTRSNVESPLTRLDNGMLDWRPTHKLKAIANKHFLNETVVLDGMQYIRCAFEHATFVYEGTAPYEMIDCTTIRREGSEPNFTIRSSNPIVGASLMLNFKLSEGSKGPIGWRFEPGPQQP